MKFFPLNLFFTIFVVSTCAFPQTSPSILTGAVQTTTKSPPIITGATQVPSSSSTQGPSSTAAPYTPLVDIPDNVRVPTWTDQNQAEEILSVIEERRQSELQLIRNVAYRGDARVDYQIGLRNMNLFMRENYNKMIDRVGHNLYPLIVATDVDHDKRLTGTGSEYILFLRNGTIRHMKPTPAQYEQNKNLAHLAMSIFTIVSPFFINPTSPHWKKPLADLRDIVSNNLILLESVNATIKHSPFKTQSVFCDNNLELSDHRDMLTLVKEYTVKALADGSVPVEGYKNFTSKYLPYAEKALTCAAQIQAQAGVLELAKWREMLGKKLWHELYVIIPVVWPVARLNPRQLIFEKLMDADRVNTHILKAEGSYSVEEARATAGRIVADRTMAHFVFGYNKRNHVEMNMALSTRRDLLATKSAGYVDSVAVTYSGGPAAASPVQNLSPFEAALDKANKFLTKPSPEYSLTYSAAMPAVEELPEVDPNEINFQP